MSAFVKNHTFLISRIILETDPGSIAARVSKPRASDLDLPISEQSFTQAFARAREQITTTLLK